MAQEKQPLGLLLAGAVVAAGLASIGGSRWLPLRLASSASFLTFSSMLLSAVEQRKREAYLDDTDTQLELKVRQAHADARLEGEVLKAKYQAAERLYEENPWLEDYLEVHAEVVPENEGGKAPSSPGSAMPSTGPSPEMQQVQPQPTATASALTATAPPIGELDGAKIIPLQQLNDINRYPVVMVVAAPGSGKTVTVAEIFSQLDGRKVVSTPKGSDHENPRLMEVFDLAFGYNHKLKKGGHFGDPRFTDFHHHLDLSWWLENAPKGGSVLEFSWAIERESQNRMANTLREDTQPWRIFFDEAAQSYLNGFSNPHDVKKTVEKHAQHILSCNNKDAFLNFRGQMLQTWFGTQVATVDSIGLQNFAAARDEAWWLYPGLRAIEVAQDAGKPALKAWLEHRASQGYGIALMVRSGVFYEVLDLPLLATMKRFDPPKTPIHDAPQQSPQSLSDRQRLEALLSQEIEEPLFEAVADAGYEPTPEEMKTALLNAINLLISRGQTRDARDAGAWIDFDKEQALWVAIQALNLSQTATIRDVFGFGQGGRKFIAGKRWLETLQAQYGQD